tara:strand:+ start:458 stop:622 length:165 start_codon:yes stop_codon:yes gene_type:complete
MPGTMKRMGKGSYGNPFSAGASTMKKKKPKKRKTPLYGRSAKPKSARPARSRGV